MYITEKWFQHKNYSWHAKYFYILFEKSRLLLAGVEPPIDKGHVPFYALPNWLCLVRWGG